MMQMNTEKLNPAQTNFGHEHKIKTLDPVV